MEGNELRSALSLSLSLSPSPPSVVFFDLLDDFSRLGVARVDDLRVMSDDALDQALLLQLLEGEAGETPADLQPLRDDGRSDQLVGRNFFHELFHGGLVEEDQVVEFVSDFSLGPLLLLGLSAAAFLRLFLRRRRRLGALSALVSRLRGHLSSFSFLLFAF